MTSNTIASSFDKLNSNNLVKISLECLWLAAVGLTPLVFVSPHHEEPLIFPYQIPKVTLFRMLVGVLIALSVIDLTRILIAAMRNQHQFNPAKGILKWLESDRTNWIIFFIIAYLVANIISTSFSPSFGLSLWGKDPAADGYSLYNVICYLMLCAILIRYIQSNKQIFRLLATVVISGWLVAVYGILQYLGMDPLGIVQTEHVRVSSTMGNPLFVGNFLLITIPLTLGVLIQKFRRMALPVFLLTIVFFIIPQILGIFLSIGRSSIISLGFSLTVLLALTWSTHRKWNLSYKPLLGFLIFFMILGGLLTSGSFKGELQDFTQPITTRLGSTYEEVISGTLGGRIEIWQASANLIVDRPWFTFDEADNQIIRHLVGYGPELFRFVFPLATNSNFENASGGIPNYAHNHFIHKIVELGLLGFIAYLGLIVSFFVVGISRLNHIVSNRPTIKWFFISIVAAMSGYTVNMVTGIPRIADLLLFWTCIALLIVLCKKTRAEKASAKSSSQILIQLPKKQKNITPPFKKASPPLYFQAILASTLALIIVVFTWQKNINYFFADQLAHSAAKEFIQKPDRSVQLINDALVLAHDVPRYHHYKSLILREIANRDSDEKRKMQTFELSVEASETALDFQPFYYPAKHTLAFTYINLGLLGNKQLSTQAIQYLEELTHQKPYDWRAHLDLASGYILLSQPTKALATNKIVSSMLQPDSGVNSLILLYDSLAYQQMGEVEQASRAAQLSRSQGGLTEEQDFLLSDLLGEISGWNAWLKEFSN